MLNRSGADQKVAGSARYYRLTRAGAEQLDRQRRQWQVVDKTMKGILSSAVDPVGEPI